MARLPCRKGGALALGSGDCCMDRDIHPYKWPLNPTK